MAELGVAVLFAAFAWWSATGAILYLDGLPPESFRRSMLGATVLLLVGLYGLARTSADDSVASAYLAFTCALLVWAWQEMSFLMGFVTGSRRIDCTPGARGWRRFGEATLAIIHHELAIAVTALVVLAITWGGPNQVGTWAFMVLWVMRLSAKLNLFLGVRNLGEQFLPEHLRYLRTYFTRRQMNPLFPISITASTVAAVMLARQAMGAQPGSFEAVASTLVAALLALAVLEHWVMVLPLPSEALWSWCLGSRSRKRPAPTRP